MTTLGDQLRERTRIIRNTDAEIRRVLALAAEDIGRILANQPSDYQRWYLPMLQHQIEQALARWGAQEATVLQSAQTRVWTAGSGMVDAVLNDAVADGVVASGIVLPTIDDAQLRAMTSFLTTKIKSITVSAADAINSELGLVVIGSKTPFDAQKAVQTLLGETTTKRAGVIVRTELARAYSTANQGRLLAWADDVPGLKKRWQKSGKIHPRIAHVAMHGQTKAVDEPFVLPSGLEIMFPHDPEAPASETINCGCVSVPVVPGWTSKVKRRKEAPIDDDAVLLSDAMKG